MIDEKDVEQIIERVKEICITRRECQNTTDTIEKKMSRDDVRLSVIESELKQIKWLIGIVLAGVFGNLLNSILGMIGG